MAAVPVGSNDLRAEEISKIVTGFALQSYKLKPLCTISTSNAWRESYYQETAAELTGGTSSSVRGIPRLAAFPYGEVTWTKQSSYLEKYGMEGVISWEDEKTDNIPVMARTMERVGRAVARAVDIQIEDTLNTNTSVNTLAITAGNEWNSATVANRDPIQNLLDAKALIGIDNYDVNDGSGRIVLNENDYAALLGNSKIISNPTFKAADIVANGVVGEIVGLKIIVSNTVTVSRAYLVKDKAAMTWQEALPLTVETIVDPMIKKTVRAGEIGVVQVTNPEAICRISNTRA